MEILWPLAGLVTSLLGGAAITIYTRVNRLVRSRGARAHWLAGAALGTLGMALMGCGWALLSTAEPRVCVGALRLPGLLFCLLSLCIYVASARWVGRWRSPARYSLGLHTAGIYAHVRHPQALSLCVLVVGLCLYSGSVPYILTAPLWLAFWTAYTFLEERWELIPTFGAEYLRYCQSTPRLLPRLPFRRGTTQGLFR